MSLIEQAAQRLEQLRQAGVEIPSAKAEDEVAREPAAAEHIRHRLRLPRQLRKSLQPCPVTRGNPALPK